MARGRSKADESSSLRLGNQVLAEDGDCVSNYRPKDIVMPEFDPYDEKLAKIYRYRKQISVNLGSWFVQENWMNPSLAECASGPKSSELDVASGWDNPMSARSALEKHWDTWITEDDFVWLAKTGVNTVRLPIGYWSLGPKYCQETAFQEVAPVYERSWPRVLRAIQWAAKHKIGVLVDLHGAVGSQNGQSHSGTSDGQIHLFDDDENMRKTTNVLIYLTKQLVPISNVVGIQVLNEPRNVASLPDFYARTIDALRELSPDAAKFPFYIHDGFNLERFAKFVGGRKDFVVQDHHSYFVFTPSDSSTPAQDHTSNINNGISSALAGAFKRARGNLVVDEWSCALTAESLSSLSSESKQLAARKSFCTSQANVYLRETAGWSFWSYKTENCEDDDGWCFRKAVGRSLPAKFSVWDISGEQDNDDDTGRENTIKIVEKLKGGLLHNANKAILRRSSSPAGLTGSAPVSTNVETIGGTHVKPSYTGPVLEDRSNDSDGFGQPEHADVLKLVHIRSLPAPSELPTSSRNITEMRPSGHHNTVHEDSDRGSAPHQTTKDITDDSSIPLGPPAPKVDDMMAASVVPDSVEPSLRIVEGSYSGSKRPMISSNVKRVFNLGIRGTRSGSTAARRAAHFIPDGDDARVKIAAPSSSHDKGHDDGYNAARMFNEFVGSRLGFSAQYMEDNIVGLLTSGALEDGNEEEYRKGFVKGLEDGERDVANDVLY
ncbi:Cellulase (glycosyl hydrolase family 5 protein) [Ceratobasidium sp. AG-Ba]|nr:Cellulase (glycosyl hydrolase family 5 protein) [Ceratobasidium sp. AG-Ba]